MKAKWFGAAVVLFLLVPTFLWFWSQGNAQQESIPRRDVTLLIDIDPESSDPNVPKIEGVDADQQGRLYTVDSAAYEDASLRGRVFRIDPKNPLLEVAGRIPACARNPAEEAFGRCFGVHFNKEGDLFIQFNQFKLPGFVADLTPRILRIPASLLASGFDAITDLDSITYANNLPGVNGFVFDKNGFLFAGGSGTGRVYMVPPGGGSSTIFNDGNLIQPFCRCSDIQAVCNIEVPPNCNPQRTVANGVAIDRKGDLFVTDTARGAIWKIDVVRDALGTPSFGGMTLFVEHPLLQGADGVTTDLGENFWVFANERNAVVRVTPGGTVHEMAHNDSHGPLEFPASGVIVDQTLYMGNFDNNRGDNRPNTNGIGASIVQMFIGIGGLE